MVDIKILEHIPWKHAFIVKTIQSGSVGALDTNSEIKLLIEKWCTDNCKGQWLIVNKTYSILYAKPQVENPSRSQDYSPSTIRLDEGYIVMMEVEEEATAFKLQFFGE